MADSDPTLSPLAAPPAPEDAQVFGYNVAEQAGTVSEPEPSQFSPLAAG
jgi:hypothetical protein